MEQISNKVNSRYLLTDGNKIGILLLLYEAEEVSSCKLLIVNNNYTRIKKAAMELKAAGLVETRRERTKISWSLTKEGRIIASRLWKAEISYENRLRSPKYYK
jgi:predicted transcriptional regulator